jgi:DNA-binding HxlR family transcriptional regulator
MRSYRHYCGLALALDRVGDRWVLLIVRELLTGQKRFSDLQAGLPGVATNLLVERLRRMEKDGLIERVALAPPAARNVYALTELGRGLAPSVTALVRWGGTFMRQRRHDQAFRPHWLAVALPALLDGLRWDGPTVTLCVAVPEGTVDLCWSRTGVRHVAAGDSPPDVRLCGPVTSVLGLAAGALNWKAAAASGLEVSGSAAAVRALRAALARHGSASLAAGSGAS